MRPAPRFFVRACLLALAAVAIGCSEEAKNETNMSTDPVTGKAIAAPVSVGATAPAAPSSSREYNSKSKSAMGDPSLASAYNKAAPRGAARALGMAGRDGGAMMAYEASAKSARAPIVNGQGYSVAQDQAAAGEAQPNTEAYDRIVDNDFLRAGKQPLSTFSIDVDTASYANVRRFLTQGQRPPKDAVRIEELLNYFPYSYTPPTGDKAFAANVEIARCPWNADHRLARIGIKGAEIKVDRRPAANLVFLVDVSGSMNSPDKLPLLQSALRMLVEQLNGDDRVAIVVYAGQEGLALPSTPCDRKQEIISALDSLSAGGGTNGAAGIQLAYDMAVSNFVKGGTNRVILCTDGDFNIGITNQGDLTRLIQEKAKSKVFLSVLGFGQGNLKDSTMEKLADLGNGNYAYIDDIKEGRKVLVEQLSGTLITIAKDVKIQVEFNPTKVGAYRLIGYENRMLKAEDFNDDKKDAGEIGAGHTVTALYELVPPDKVGDLAKVDDLKYSKPAPAADEAKTESNETMTVKIRFKAPEGDESKKIEQGITDEGQDYAKASGEFKFAAAVAAFGMILRDSPHKGTATLDGVTELASEGLGPDEFGYRKEFIELVRATRGVVGAKP